MYQIRDTSSSSNCDIIVANCETWLQMKAIAIETYSKGVSIAVWHNGKIIFSMGQPALMDA